MFGTAEICAPPSVRASLSRDALGVALKRADAMLRNESNLVFVSVLSAQDLGSVWDGPLTKLTRIVDPGFVSLKSQLTLCHLGEKTRQSQPRERLRIKIVDSSCKSQDDWILCPENFVRSLFKSSFKV